MIKILAIIFMLIDHIGYVFFSDWTFLRVIGRLALPLFAYGITQGYIRTRNVKMYFFRLLILALVSQIPYNYALNTGYYNVVFTLCMGLIILIVIESKINTIVKSLICLIVFFICDVFYFEYGIYCLLLILNFYKFRNNYSKLISGQLVITVFGVIVYNYQLYQFVSILAVPIIMASQLKDFKLPKVIGYGFYPIHLIFIYYFLTIS